MFSGLLDRIPGSISPALCAGADEFDRVIGAFGMDHLRNALGHSIFSL
jgi:hypothetical protein